MQFLSNIVLLLTQLSVGCREEMNVAINPLDLDQANFVRTLRNQLQARPRSLDTNQMG